MNENVLAVLLYIFKNHIRTYRKMPPEDASLFEELEMMGFDTETIFLAFEWLAELYEMREDEESRPTPESDAFRIYAGSEFYSLGTKAQGCLSYLEQAGILNAITRERVIDRLLRTEVEDIDPHTVKLITLLVLLGDDNEVALGTMEQFLLTKHGTGMH